MPLTDKEIKAATFGKAKKKMFDGGGLFLLLGKDGTKWWRLKYRFLGREKGLSLGVYPTTTLKEARERRDEAKKLLANAIDPSAHRQAIKASRLEAADNTFEVVAREWHAKFSKKWADSTAEAMLRRLEVNIFPWLGSRPVAEITPKEMLVVLRRIEERGARETVHRAKQNCGQVFRYAIATGRSERDSTRDLKGALEPIKVKHHPSIIEPHAIGGLLRAIRGYDGSVVTKAALRLAPLSFVRPGELRQAEWAEFDLDKAEWRLPASHTKNKIEPHIVPLSRQAIGVLKELMPITGTGKFVFPGARSINRPMSENTVNAALRRLGYAKDEMTGHGFRSMASTHLNEQGWNRDAIERQLSHAERNGVRAAYNYAEHLPERRRMMQAWADYLDRLRSGAEVVQLREDAA